MSRDFYHTITAIVANALLLALLVMFAVVPAGATQAGIDWTSVTYSHDLGWMSVTYGNNTFVAVAQVGAGNQVMSSPDGITWTALSSVTSNLHRNGDRSIGRPCNLCRKRLESPLK